MKVILDRNENLKSKDNGWLVVMIVNIMIICVACLYAIFTSSSSSILQSISGFLIMVNSILVFLSFSYHKNYWKKWLIMAAFGVVLFIIVIIFQLIIDVSKFELSLWKKY